MRAVPAGTQLAMICAYMKERIGVDFNPFQCQGFAILTDTDDFVGAVIVSNVRYSGSRAIDCELSCASESSVAWQHHVCRAVFQYVFAQLGCVRCTSITKKNNTRARGFLEALNFVLEGNVRKGYDGEKDALVYGLLAEECQFFGGLNG